MNINIPPDSRQWLFAPRGDDMVCSWSFRWPPPCEVGDPLYFRFDGSLIVASAKVYAMFKPGEFNGVSHNGKRFLTGHKVMWAQSDFRDLRDDSAAVKAILEAERNRRREMAGRRS